MRRRKATAAYGSLMEPRAKTLRQFQDRILLTNAARNAFVRFYHTCAPPVLAFIARHEKIRNAVGFPSCSLWAYAG